MGTDPMGSDPMGTDPGAVERPQRASEQGAPPGSRKFSAEEMEEIRRETEQRIDEFMKRIGYTDPSRFTDGEGWRWFQYGPARGRAGIVASDPDGEMFLRAESLVMEVPADKDELFTLMRDLLEINMTLAGPTRLAINGQGVFVCATIPIVQLRPGDVPAHIHSVLATAEKFITAPDEEAKREGAKQEDNIT